MAAEFRAIPGCSYHGLLIQRLDQSLAKASEKLGVIPFAPATSGMAVFRVGKNQIDVRREVQFATAQFAHAEDQQRLWFALIIAHHCTAYPIHRSNCSTASRAR